MEYLGLIGCEIWDQVAVSFGLKMKVLAFDPFHTHEKSN